MSYRYKMPLPSASEAAAPGFTLVAGGGIFLCLIAMACTGSGGFSSTPWLVTALLITLAFTALNYLARHHLFWRYLLATLAAAQCLAAIGLWLQNPADSVSAGALAFLQVSLAIYGAAVLTQQLWVITQRHRG